MVPPLSLDEKRLAAVEKRLAQPERGGGVGNNRLDPAIALGAGLHSLGQVPIVRATKAAAQEFANNVEGTVSFPTETFDPDEMHPAASLTTLYAWEAGVYLIGGEVEFAVDTDGDRYLAIRLNGTTKLSESSHRAADGFAHREHVGTIWDMGISDYVELRAHHTAGAALDIDAGRFWMVKIAEIG